MSTKVYQTKALEKGIKNTIVKDKNGYYRITLGSFNDYNANGIFYRVKDIDAILGEGTIVHRRLSEGLLRAELKHPDVTGLTPQQLKQRTIRLDLDNIVGHYKKIEVVPRGVTNKEFNLPIYDVYGWIRPENPKGPQLKDMLENPDANTAGSIRSLVYQKRIGTTIVRDVVIVSTWDIVPEPGVSQSTQWNAAGLENLEEGIIFDGNVTIENEQEIEKLKHAFEEAYENMDTKCKDGKCVIDSLTTYIKNHSNPLYDL